MSNYNMIGLLLICINVSQCQDLDFMDNLTASGYDKRVIPNQQGGVNVTSQIHIISLGSIDEQTFTYETEFYFRHWWHDHRLKIIGPTIKINTDTPPEQLLWTPELAITNARKIDKYENAVRTIVKTNGDIYMSRRLYYPVGQNLFKVRSRHQNNYVRFVLVYLRIKAKCTCTMDLTYYPMDTQICNLIFESYAYPNADMSLAWHQRPISNQDELLKTTGYVVEKIWTESKKVSLGVGSGNEAYDNLLVFFKVKRNFLYFVYRAYIPTILLMVFNMLSYWIPSSAIPARVTLIVTTFLASVFILQSVSESTVKVSYTTPMQMFMLVNVLLIVLSIVEFVVVLFLRKYSKKTCTLHKPEDFKMNGKVNPGYVNAATITKKVDNTNKSIDITKEKGIYKMNVEEKDVSDTIDVIFRVTVPICYLVFCCVYFTYYLYLV